MDLIGGGRGLFSLAQKEHESIKFQARGAVSFCDLLA